MSSVDNKYTSGTFRIKIKPYASGTFRDIGNIVVGSLGETIKELLHHQGDTGSIDKRIRIRQAININFTFDNIDIDNLAMALNESVAANKIKLGDGGSLVDYAAEISHQFLDGDTLVIGIPKCNIQPTGEEIINFPQKAEAWTQGQLRLGSLYDENAPDGEEHGYIEYTEGS